MAEWIVGLMTFRFNHRHLWWQLFARHFNISSENCAILGFQHVDQFLFGLIIVLSIFLNSSFFEGNTSFGIAMIYFFWNKLMLTSSRYLKIERSICNSLYLAKIWTLSLLGFLIDLTFILQVSLAFYYFVLLEWNFKIE